MKGVHFDKARNKWEATARRNGKRIFRIRFDTEEEANDAMEKFNDILRQGGLDALNWDSNAFTEWKSAKEILNGGSVIEAALFYKKHASMVSEKKTVSDAVNEFLEEKKKMRSEYHYKDLHSRLKMVFCSSFGTYICPDVKTDEIRRFLLSRGNAPRTIINNSRVISSFFNWCVRRKYCSFNPCNDIHESDLPEDMGGRIGILTPEE